MEKITTSSFPYVCSSDVGSINSSTLVFPTLINERQHLKHFLDKELKTEKITTIFFAENDSSFSFCSHGIYTIDS